MDFYINKNATLPLLVMELIQDGRNDYRDFNDKIQNCNITFSMADVETGVRKVSNQAASCLLKDCCVDCDEEYYVIYQWKERDTLKPGIYKGEFVFEFLDGSGTLIAPIREELYIHVREGSIKKC